jgi:aminoglycoside phosphotransferase
VTVSIGEAGRVAGTHDLIPDGDRVVKRYRSWDRGEHVREWTMLRAAAPHLPGVVPRPLAHDLRADPPWIAMTRLAGDPMGGALSGPQLDALEVALRRLWSVPVDGLPPRRLHPAEAREVIGGGLAAAPRPGGTVGRAYDVCMAHLASPGPRGRPVLGHGDANLANYLWDGATVRLVDFEDGGVSTVEDELAFLAEHLAGRATDWEPFVSRFDTDPSRLRSARLTCAAHWLLLLLPGGPAAERNPPGALEEQARRILTLSLRGRP